MSSLSEYKKKKLLSIESAQASASIESEKDKEHEPARLGPEEVKDLAKWMKEVLIGKVSNITVRRLPICSKFRRNQPDLLTRLPSLLTMNLLLSEG